MKFTISTNKLKDMVSKSIKGAGNNKLIPITSLMALQLKDNQFTLITTDATNYLYVIEDKVVGDDFLVTVPADMFSKLISRMTSENVSFNIRPDVKVLEINGNGSYKIELPLDESGQLIKYPNPLDAWTTDNKEETTINLSTIGVILDSIKPSLAVTLENPCYTGYYVGDSVVATDTFKIADMNVKLFNEKALISSEMMDLFNVMTAEKINVQRDGDKIVFKSPNCIIYGTLMDGIDDYAIDAIKGLVDTEFDSMGAFPKADLLSVLDRLSLFVGPYDKNAINLIFTRDGLQISSKASSGVELVKYCSSDNFKDFMCMIDIEMFMQEVKAIKSDIIEMYYGEDNAIKIIDGNISIIIALFEDDIAS